MKLKGYPIVLNLLLMYLIASGSEFLSTQNSSILSNEPIMIIRDVLFAFGWSANIDVWSINNESVLLNNKALIMPPATPIREDAGPIQINPSAVYINNVAFGFMWSNATSEKYRSSTSMLVGTETSVNSRGMIKVSKDAIEGDAGSHQTNPSCIYFNNIHFHFAWSKHTQDEYRPSADITVGETAQFNYGGLVMPPTSSTEGDAGANQRDTSIIDLNNMGFYFGWSPYLQDIYRSSPNMQTGSPEHLNTNGLIEPPRQAVSLQPWIIACDETGNEKQTFDISEDFYVIGGNFPTETNLTIYIIPDGLAPFPGNAIACNSVLTDSEGNLSPTLIWKNPLTVGNYDIWVDVNQNQVYDDEIDVYVNPAIGIKSFSVISEFPTSLALTIILITAILIVIITQRSRRKRMEK